MKNILPLLLALVFASGLTAQKGYGPGERIADFTLKDAVSGRRVSLQDYEDRKGLILVFTCNSCPYAKAYEQRIMALDRDFASMGYPVIAVNPNDPGRVPEDRPEAMKERAQIRGYTFPYLIDEKQELAQRFAAGKTPEVYLLKKRKDGGFELVYHGAIDDSPMNPEGVKKHYVADAIRALESGSTPMTESSPAIGCSIKWKE